MSPFRPRERYRDLKRYSNIATVLIHHGFKEILDRLRARYHVTFVQEQAHNGQPVGERLRLVFEELGPTFIKFAQVLSSRPDVLPAEIIKELSK
ncbi:MAG: hypothetical protein LLF89_02190, partial [Spirochaetaceae bacterium]|nr:hypothetical protein [Spirochaetaceae bacterium]